MKVKHVLLSTVFVAAAALSGAAFAQGYIGGSVGQSDADLDCAGTTSCDNKDTGFKVFGGYMFTPNFGVEGTYFDLGKATAAGTDPFLGDFTGEFKAKGFAVYGVAAAPIDNWVLFGKLGLASTEVEVSATSSVFGAGSDSETKANVAWGLGGGYNFTKNLGARLEWERFRGEFEDEKTDIDLISVGVQYRF